MSTTTQHVRRHLVAQLEALGDLTDKDGRPLPADEIKLQIEAAKAASGLAQAYAATLKVDLQACEMVNGRALPADLGDVKLIAKGGEE